MRALDYLSISFMAIIRQPLRTLLTVVALAISTSILVVLMAISIGAQNAVKNGFGFTKSLTTVVVTPNQNSAPSLIGGSVQIANNSAAIIDDAAVASLGTIPNVASSRPVAGLWELKQFAIEGREQTFVSQASGTTSAGPLVAGRDFKNSANEVVVGWSYIRELGLNEANAHELLGKTITFTTQDAYRGEGAVIPTNKSSRQQHEQFTKTPTILTATIVGVSKQGAADNQIQLPLEWARKIKTVTTYTSQGVREEVDQIEKSGYTSVILQAEDEKHVRGITEAVAQKGYGFISIQEQLDQISALTTVMWGLFGAIAFVSLITACLGIANTMLTTISEQRFAIGVWRAVGARRRMIAMQFIVQAALLGLCGGIVGMILGWVAAGYVSTYITKLLVTQGLPATTIVDLSPLLLCVAVVTALVFGCLSGLYPAWRASRQSPSEILSAGQ